MTVHVAYEVQVTFMGGSVGLCGAGLWGSSTNIACLCNLIKIFVSGADVSWMPLELKRYIYFYAGIGMPMEFTSYLRPVESYIHVYTISMFISCV